MKGFYLFKIDTNIRAKIDHIRENSKIGIEKFLNKRTN